MLVDDRRSPPNLDVVDLDQIHALVLLVRDADKSRTMEAALRSKSLGI
jgi:hypothetical protein